MLDGHWLVLQSVAWTRMVVNFSRHDSLATAVSKTLDGDHLCPMCRKIMAARQREEQQQKNTSLVKTEKMSEFILGGGQTLPSFTPTTICDMAPVAPRLHTDFLETPPSPPPRRSFAVL